VRKSIWGSLNNGPVSFRLAPILIVLPACLGTSAPATDGRGDAAWYDQRQVGVKFPAKYVGEIRSSRYVTMRDGCRIAIELFLPQGLRTDEKVPTLLHQTRYWRSIIYNWPLDKLREPERLTNLRHFFVARGYAWISVDVRGSGASFGYRPCEYSPDEIKDGKDIVDWIIRQPWSDGQVCSTGISYDGGTAEFLATNKHPAVKAVAPLFSMFDPYLEVVFPGGVHISWFTAVWGGLGRALDRNTVPELILERFGPTMQRLVRGVRPVEEDRDGSILAAAVRSHAYNWNLHETTLRVVFRDDELPYDWNLSFDSLSPYVFAKDIDAAGPAVYSYSGWLDAAFQHAAIKRHLTLTGSKNRLTIGPWNHGGEYNCDPLAPGKSHFGMIVELFRFFENVLRGADTGISGDKPVHYYTMGQEKWKAADTWPPHSEPRPFYFGPEGTLTGEKPTSADASDTYDMNYTHATGARSRWNCLVMGGTVTYPDRKEQDAKLLCYTSAPLTEDMEVTGHPVVTLHVSSPRKDGNFFVYLEDVDETGRVRYVSEGMLRAIHRKVSSESPPYKLLVPYHTYRRADAMMLVPGEAAELTFDILPTSYQFKAGHRIRVAVAGADADHFANPPGPPPTIKVYRSASLASGIVLPGVPRDGG
jgi:putative CocE/NonD family hydrolase